MAEHAYACTTPACRERMRGVSDEPTFCSVCAHPLTLLTADGDIDMYAAKVRELESEAAALRADVARLEAQVEGQARTIGKWQEFAGRESPGNTTSPAFYEAKKIAELVGRAGSLEEALEPFAEVWRRMVDDEGAFKPAAEQGAYRAAWYALKRDP